MTPDDPLDPIAAGVRLLEIDSHVSAMRGLIKEVLLSYSELMRKEGKSQAYVHAAGRIALQKTLDSIDKCSAQPKDRAHETT